MINWIRENAVIFTLALAAVGIISTVAVTRYQVSGLMDAQPAIQQHINDTTRHIDPVRDAEEKRQMRERIEQLERQIRWMERRQSGVDWRERREGR